MGDSKTMTMEELKEGNPMMCLSSKRVFNKCYLCEYYKGCASRRINKKKIKEIENLEAKEDYYKNKLTEIRDKLEDARQ